MPKTPKQSAWLRTVAKYRKDHPNTPNRLVFQRASKLYRSKTPSRSVSSWHSRCLLRLPARGQRRLAVCGGYAWPWRSRPAPGFSAPARARTILGRASARGLRQLGGLGGRPGTLSSFAALGVVALAAAARTAEPGCWRSKGSSWSWRCWLPVAWKV